MPQVYLELGRSELVSRSVPEQGRGNVLEALQVMSGISLLFAVGARPTVGDVERLLAGPEGIGKVAQISHRPPEDQGWIELLASGLTFDLRGLAPGNGATVPPHSHLYGLSQDIGKFEFEAISLVPGVHIAAGGALLPVVRVLMRLAAVLTTELPVRAVCWNPAQAWMEPKYFSRIMAHWLSGGPFPSLGLTALRRRDDGAVESSGLAYFTGQELCVAEHDEAAGSETMKLAARVIDKLVAHGRLEKSETFAGLEGERLIAEPSPDGRYVVVTKAA